MPLYIPGADGLQQSDFQGASPHTDGTRPTGDQSASGAATQSSGGAPTNPQPAADNPQAAEALRHVVAHTQPAAPPTTPSPPQAAQTPPPAPASSASSGSSFRSPTVTPSFFGSGSQAPDHHGFPGGPYGGGEMGQGEARYAAAVQQSFQAQTAAQVAQQAIQSGNLAQAAQIMRSNPNVGVTVNGSPAVYGEEAARAIAGQTMHQLSAAHEAAHLQALAPLNQQAGRPAAPSQPLVDIAALGEAPPIPPQRPQVSATLTPLPAANAPGFGQAVPAQPAVDVASLGEAPALPTLNQQASQQPASHQPAGNLLSAAQVEALGAPPPPPSASTLIAGRAGTDQAAQRRANLQSRLPVIAPPQPTTVQLPPAGDEADDSPTATTAQRTPSPLGPPTAAEQRRIAQAAADGAAAGRSFTASVTELGAERWSSQIDVTRIGTEVYRKAAEEVGLSETQFAEFLRQVSPVPYVVGEDGALRPMLPSDLDDYQVMARNTNAAGEYQAVVPNGVLNDMRAVKAGARVSETVTVVGSASAVALPLPAGTELGRNLTLQAPRVGPALVAVGAAAGEAALPVVAGAVLLAPAIIAGYELGQQYAAQRAAAERARVLPLSLGSEIAAGPPPIVPNRQPPPVVPPTLPDVSEQGRRLSEPLTTPATSPSIATAVPPSGTNPPLPVLPLPPLTPIQDDRLRHVLFDPIMAKPVNLPAWNKITVDMEHIISGHTATGSRAIQSGQKDLFPQWMTEAHIAKAIETAYKDAKKIGTQGDRVLLQGVADGLLIEMYVNLKTKEIETAYPPSR